MKPISVFFATYRDRTEGAETEYVGAFYNNAGKLLKSFDFASNADAFGFAHPAPKATLLSNGNLAVVWQKTNVDGSFMQIFKPNGAKVGVEKALDNIPAISGAHPNVIVTDPNGGFYVANAPYQPVAGGVGSLGPIKIQKYTNFGKKVGKEISFDTVSDTGSSIRSARDFDVAFTKDGLIAVAWTGSGIGGTGVYFAMLTAGGKVIVGPQVADMTLNDDQLEVQFTTLKNGGLYLTFKDDATVQFQYVSSIQGRFIVEPDYLYEGDGKDNNNSGTNGNDVLLGFGGDDNLTGGKGEDYIKGGKGDDRISGGDRIDELLGEDGNDKLFGDNGNDQLFGGKGKDTLNGGGNDDELYGGDGSDIIKGGRGTDTAYGGAGNDKLTGGSVASELYGGDGRDVISGQSGTDRMYGEAGNDKLIGNAGNDAMYGDDGKDRLFGGDGFDVLNGGNERDKLYGGSGNDALYSGDGNDLEYGGAGDDRFYDSKGDDRLTGGSGADVFQFYSTDFGHDVITDFEFGVDKLDMGTVAYGLENTTGGSIKVAELSSGVRFKVDADNWVLVKGATLSDFVDGDFIINNPYG